MEKKRLKFKKIPSKRKNKRKNLSRKTERKKGSAKNGFFQKIRLEFFSYLPQISRFFSAMGASRWLKAGSGGLLILIFFFLTAINRDKQIEADKKKWTEKAEVILRMQKTEREITFWEKILEEKGDHRDTFLLLSFLNYKTGRKEIAKDYWKRAWELDPNNEKVKNLEKIINK